MKLDLDKNVLLPANAVAKVSQTSLLGSLHVELAPPTDRPPTGRLVDGSRITEANTDRFPPPRRFLGAGVVVNKGNVGALEEIIDETHQAVAGRQAQFVNLVPRLAELTAGLNRQVHDIIDALDGLNRVSAILARDKDNLGEHWTRCPTRFACSTRTGTTSSTRSPRSKVDDGHVARAGRDQGGFR